MSSTTENPRFLGEGWKWPLIINTTCIMVVGITSNVFTLISLPYVRVRYGQEFSILQTSSALLLFHLSFCDLLYCVIAFPHYIEIYTLGYFPHSEKFCQFLAIFRNLVAYADFLTMAMISVCVCYHRLCRICRSAGHTVEHSHHDFIFGGPRIVGIFISIWSIAGICIDPWRLFGTIFKWSGNVTGCEIIYSTWIGQLVHYVIFAILVMSYICIILKVIKDNMEVQDNEEKCALYKKQTIRIVCVAIMLPLSYFLFVFLLNFLPLNNPAIRCFYWWMYGINFVLYIITSKRLRNAYLRFLRDLYNGNIFRMGLEVSTTTSNSSSIWWIALRENSNK